MGFPSFLVVTNSSNNLVLSDVNGHVLWTTSATTATGAEAVLMNTGNLILRSPNGTVLWQSFDHPTDTLLPGMKMRRSNRTQGGSRLVSWSSPEDPSPGTFSFGGEAYPVPQGFIWNGSLPIWRTPVTFGRTAASWRTWHLWTPSMRCPYVLPVSDGAPYVRYVMSYSGRVEVYGWDSNSSSDWTMLTAWPTFECSRYGYCGPSGYCDFTGATPTCKCLDGFEPVDKGEWSIGSFSQGCHRKEALRCRDGFLELPGMQVPDKFVRIRHKALEECAAECSSNCSCVAYAYANLNSSISKDDATRVDTQKIGADSNVGADSQETLYLRVASLSGMISRGKKYEFAGGKSSTTWDGERTKHNAVKITLPVLASVVILSSILLVWACKFRGRKRNTENQNKIMNVGWTASNELAEDSATHDIDFPFLKFQDILVATNNFSQTSMIGRGGFGKVYKGTLEGGREVAIKRHSRDSDQGIEEFRNEVVLIAKLQHRNLVRLLACYVEGDERLLIYEYLPNKSLDATIFKSERNAMLDWSMRFKIIKGIAKGLLYLHHDSRLTIVHRDLKAGNVLLDAEMRPKIADFGMARIFGENQENANTRRVVGTYGYMAPEYAMEGIFSVKSDVNSFGVLLLEVVSGIKISSVDCIMGYPNLIVYAWNLWKEGKSKDLVDKCIAENCLLDEASLCIQVGLLCVQENPDDRPFMSSVVFNLENGCTTLPKPNHPAYFAKRNSEMEQIEEDILNSENTVTLTVIEGR
ncbi:hypothetical protein EJB05_43845, partial [Eragrostis curvula]